MRHALLTVVLLTGASLTFAAVDTPVPAKSVAAAPILQRVAVIGASVSAGFGLDRGHDDPSTPSKIQLANVIEASILGTHEPIDNQATHMFFLSVDLSSKQALEEIQAKKPTLVVGVDYLFWFAYGSGTEAKRLEHFEKALKGLETLSATILLGDLPDMTPATKVKEPMLMAAQVPQPETLKKINERLHAWAGEHKNVVLVPMASMTAKLQGDEEISVRDNKWPKGSYDRLMQADHLHTTLEGTSALWLLAVDALMQAKSDVPATAFDLDAASIVKKVESAPPTAGAPEKSKGGTGKGAKKPPVKEPKKG